MKLKIRLLQDFANREISSHEYIASLCLNLKNKEYDNKSANNFKHAT